MARHTITLEELDEWLGSESWEMAACSHGKGADKRLERNSEGTFRVTDHREVVYLGTDKMAAIAAYNAAP